MPNAERVLFIRHALRAGFTIEEIFNLTKIDRWFLVQIKEIVDFEEELAGGEELIPKRVGSRAMCPRRLCIAHWRVSGASIDARP